MRGSSLDSSDKETAYKDVIRCRLVSDPDVGSRWRGVGISDVFLSEPEAVGPGGLNSDNTGDPNLRFDCVGGIGTKELEGQYRWRYWPSAIKAVTCARPWAQEGYSKKEYPNWCLGVCSKQNSRSNTSLQPDCSNNNLMRNKTIKQLNEYKRSFNFRLNSMQKNYDNNYYVQKFIYIYANIQSIFRNKAFRQTNVGNKQTSSRHMCDELRPVLVIRHKDVGGRSQCIGRIRPNGFEVRIGRVGGHRRHLEIRQYIVGNQRRRRVYKDLSGRIQLSLSKSVTSDTSSNKRGVTYMVNLVIKISYAKNANLFFNTVFCKNITFNLTHIIAMYFEYNNSQKDYVNFIVYKHSNGPPPLCSRKVPLKYFSVVNKSFAISRNYRIFCANIKIISYANFFTFRKSTTIILEMNRVVSIMDMEKEVQEVDEQGLPEGDARRVTLSIVNFKQEEMETLPTDNNRRLSRSSHNRNEKTNLEPETNDNPGDLTRINVRSKENRNNAKIIAKRKDENMISKRGETSKASIIKKPTSNHNQHLRKFTKLRNIYKILCKSNQDYLKKILMRAGDIESNPGPGPSKIPELMILEELKLSSTLTLPERELYNIEYFNFEEFLLTPRGITIIKEKLHNHIYSCPPCNNLNNCFKKFLKLYIKKPIPLSNAMIKILVECLQCIR